MMKIMEERRKTIADGLAAAEKGHRDLELTEIQITDMLTETKAKAAKIVEQAEVRAHHMIEEAKAKARQEGERLLDIAKGEISQQTIAARDQLMKEVSGLALAGAEKILNKSMDADAKASLADEMIKEV